MRRHRVTAAAHAPRGAAVEHAAGRRELTGAPASVLQWSRARRGHACAGPEPIAPECALQPVARPTPRSRARGAPRECGDGRTPRVTASGERDPRRAPAASATCARSCGAGGRSLARGALRIGRRSRPVGVRAAAVVTATSARSGVPAPGRPGGLGYGWSAPLARSRQLGSRASRVADRPRGPAQPGRHGSAWGPGVGRPPLAIRGAPRSCHRAGSRDAVAERSGSHDLAALLPTVARSHARGVRCFTFYGPAVASPAVQARLDELAARYGLPSGATALLAALLDLVATEPASITSVRDPERGVDVHVADSLVALEIDAVRDARNLADLGSGGGFPGWPWRSRCRRRGSRSSRASGGSARSSSGPRASWGSAT